MSRWLRASLCLLIGVLALTLLSCRQGIGVRRVNQNSLLAAWQASMLHDGAGLSPRTLQTLRRLDLERLYVRHPDEAFTHLHQLAVSRAEPDVLFALAEMSYLMAADLEKQNNCEAIAYYYLCAGYAYHYLFGTHPLPPVPALVPETACSQHPPEEVFDPRFRLACDIYNLGLEKCIRAAQRVGRLDPRQVLQLPSANGSKFLLSVTHHGFAWHPEEFGPLLFCSDYRVTGLSNHFRTYGLGVPLIGIRQDAANCAPGDAFYPREVSFPVTAFFRFEGSVAELGERKAGRLELYNPLTIRKLRIWNRAVPLETDLTTPLAYFLNQTDLNGIEFTAFLRADQVQDRSGIYLFEPYQPGKIPVLLVHGLFSSPLTWAPLFNELRADPVLNKHFQFWFYLYPSGTPYLVTAAELRQHLARLRHEIDPGHRDPALDQMVLAGHSLGGIISKLVTVDSGEDFWNIVSCEPLDSLKITPKAREKLRQIFYFEQEPAIKRVIFLGTPHRGSKLSPSLLGRITTKLIRLPKGLVAISEDLFKENPELLTLHPGGWKERRLPTSVDLLGPRSPALKALAQRPPLPGVHYHSILAVYHGEGKNSNDGVVTYSSAHLDEAESEILVPAHHINVHHHPGAMLEVRRILHQHLQELAALHVLPSWPAPAWPRPQVLPAPHLLPMPRPLSAAPPFPLPPVPPLPNPPPQDATLIFVPARTFPLERESPNSNKPTATHPAENRAAASRR